MSAHTEGPWEVYAAPGCVVSIQTRAIPDEFPSGGGTLANMEEYDDARADAARIVACVNACEGIADPSAVKEMLKALEEINTAACYASEVNTDAREAVLLRIGKLARQAIAKAEGRSDE